MKEIGRPLKAPSTAADTGFPAESVRNEPVTVAVALGPFSAFGFAVPVSSSRGDVVGPPETVSQPRLPGPWSHPNQFSVASTAAAPLPTSMPEPEAAVLPTMRSSLMTAVPVVTSIAPPAGAVPPVTELPVNVEPVTVSAPLSDRMPAPTAPPLVATTELLTNCELVMTKGVPAARGGPTLRRWSHSCHWCWSRSSR